jgi:glycosyltransferase involved in cell wall biosynthesis
MSPQPQLSVVIPSFNRPEPLKYTLKSVVRAAVHLSSPVEILLVDDGSIPPMAEQLRDFDAGAVVTHLRQSNQGSIVARLTGLRAAQGEFVLFIDSDDLVHPEKFARQIRAMTDTAADVSYADMAVATLGAGYEITGFEPAETLAKSCDPASFFIEVQPAPHNPIYRRTYLQRALKAPLIPAVRAMDPSGDVWLYYNLSAFPAKIVKIGGPLSASVPHDEDRYSRHWEKLGFAALQIMERFMRDCPKTRDTIAARRAVGEAAFRTWRGLPRDFNDGFARRMLSVYRQSPRGPSDRLGAASFARLAGLIGPVMAGRLIRRFHARPYSETRTLSAAEYDRLSDELEVS